MKQTHGQSGFSLQRHSLLALISHKLHASIRYWHLRSKKQQLLVIILIGLLVVGATGTAWFLKPSGDYAISSAAQSLIPEPQKKLAKVLKKEAGTYHYNKDYVAPTETKGDSSTPRFMAEFSQDPSKGVRVTDPESNLSFSMVPNFATKTPKQSDNRLVYPLKRRDAQLVYTTQVAKVKEDIILNSYQGNELTFDYSLKLPSGTEARMEQNGSVGIYGANDELMGNVVTGTDKDKALLEKARQNSPKNQLLFTIPAPFIKEYKKHETTTRAWFSLEKNKLTVHASGLKDAAYPLTIDPTIYIDSAADLMYGNNESNIDFDVDYGLIQKGKTTGGRFDNWVTNPTSLPSSLYNHSTVAYGGFMYVMGGNNGTSANGKLSWAKINNSTGAVEASSPSGDGTDCGGWCTNNVYDLPDGAVRQGAAMVAYNGYLYVIGGNDNSNARTNTVFIAKLGVNGEPQLWHPSDSNKANWVYWYQDATLGSAITGHRAVAFNNHLYIVGGSTSGSPNGDTAIQKMDILPTGLLVNRTTATVLPAGRYEAGVQVYNDRIYVIGGRNANTVQNTVYFNKINADGSLNNWQTGNPINNSAAGGARASRGGNFTTIWGGYLYVAGGCTVINTSGVCTTAASDIQISSINADGSNTDWTAILGVIDQRMGGTLLAWRNRLYAVGGCTTQTNATNCTNVLNTVKIGNINPDGDVSTVSTSVADGTAPCNSTGGYLNCDMPLPGDNQNRAGRMSGATIINNGYIYYFGGCTVAGNGSVCFTGNSGKATPRSFYGQITSTGDVTRVPNCASNTWYGSWCIVVNGLPTSNAAFGYAVFNNTLYIIGGTTGSSAWLSDISRSTFNPDGTWGTWTSQTFSSINAGTPRGYLYAFTRANPAGGNTVGNLYLLGGCDGALAGLDCATNIYSEVYKCNILADGSIDTTNSCTTSGQLQIDSEPNTPGTNEGLGVMAGTVYANYVYLIGGQSPNQAERGAVMYAKIDNNNDIVSVDGGSTWATSPNSLDPVRRRGVAFGYNGYLYALAGYNISEGGSLQDLLYAKINVSDGSIGQFQTSSVTVSPRWDLRAAVNNGYVYAMGGCSIGAPPASCTTMTGTVQTFQLYNNYSGSTKQYNAGPQFATDRYGAGTAVLNGYMYIAGGCTSTTDCATATNSVQYAPINADGTVDSWSAAANLPVSTGWGKLLAAGNTLYYIGGQTGGSSAGTTNAYYATISGGNVSAWTATAGLPAGRAQFGAAVWNNRLYIAGGNDTSGNPTSTVYVSSQQTTGGAITSWDTASTGFNVARNGPAVIAYANNLYVLGGYTGSRYLNDVQYSQLNTTNGRSGSWTYSNSLPSSLRQAEGFGANGFMYLFGGRSDNTTCRSNTIVAPISANTTIATGNQPTGIGDWYATNVRYGGDRYGAGVVYNEGKAYILGGQCNGTMVTTTNKLQYSTLQAQPQLARYSRLIDTDSDVSPTSWLINGLDNSIGARWSLKYSSMSNPLAPVGQQCSGSVMSLWGQETNYGAITLGSPAPYIPKDLTGNNMGCGRYFYLNVSIDSSQAYGYPEDVTRGPTITDVSLNFTADPSKRLMHGRTFTGGVQQPDDTPYYQN